MHSFADFFLKATEKAPYGYQSRLADKGLPDVLKAPTGTGKTAAAVLSWLWRRLHGPNPEAEPRRLIFALPQRTLVEQAAREVHKWLANLALTDKVELHVVMGGEGRTQGRWRQHMHRPTIVVGTVDSLVSKALMRGYGIGRAIYPVDFALVTNGAHWVIDEIQLCPESTTTLRQLGAFMREFSTAEPVGLTCMSATISDTLLRTVDNRALGTVVEIETGEREGELATRLNAARTIRRLKEEPGDYAAIAAAVRARHRPNGLSLVVVNTVAAAREIYKALRGADAALTLLHSRFRGVEREQLIERLRQESNHIVVSTQVIEAGVDLNASVLVTEAAPWPSLVQRAGRCNRTGRVDSAELWWLPPAKHHPYEQEDIDASVAELSALEGIAVTGKDLLAREVDTAEPTVSVIRRTDLLTLFDTAPDFNGADLDIAPYVRDADDSDVQLAWAEWTPAEADGRPSPDAKAPTAQWRCRVPLGELRSLLKRAAVWRFDQAIGRWTRVTPQRPARPGEVLVAAAKDGGYDRETGFDPTAKSPVPDCPSLNPRLDPAAGTDEAFRRDETSVARQWLSLEQHSEDVRQQVEALVNVLRPRLPEGAAAAAAMAGYAHDAGKAHPTWQGALCRLAPEEQRPVIDANRAWAKSGVDGRLEFPDATGFRHELVSLLLLDDPLRGLLAGLDDPDLVRYLALTHHGKLRVQVRGPDDSDETTLLGLKDGDVVPIKPMLGQPAGELIVSLDQFQLGGSQSWTRTALGLRDRYGPFVLAYLEALVRVADWRASASDEVPK